jgi:hypothetical protein
MTKTSKGRVFSTGSANTLFVSIPADMVLDAEFPFEDGQPVEVRIDDDAVVVEE